MGLVPALLVAAKLLLTAFATTILMVKIELIGHAASLAAETILPRTDLRAIGMELALHTAGSLMVLLVPAVLSDYKPRGLTSYGRRKQHEQRAPSQQPYFEPRRPSLDSNDGLGVWPGSGSITITLRRGYVFGIAVIVLVVHFFILHASGIGLSSH